jgi:hypothetical protein
MRGVAPEASAQRACERSNERGRGAAGSPDPEPQRERAASAPDPEQLIGRVEFGVREDAEEDPEE